MDRIRFDARFAARVAGHELLVYVNEVEMTAIGAGMGMSPSALLAPENLLLATATPTRIPIASCDCGSYECGATDVTIVRDGDVVRWTWELQTPIDRDAVFAADQYDAEVERIAADRGWERPQGTAAR